ncbi:hypothetical protein Q7C36_016897 [Tachysurus vachellii]|uniref:Uncharacterized protein n=1 Tax=Tachysurus vachellii TaxID=175792 RepID=A0AA88M751_TACVA|nr:hypothetical protein Q7C36_016897 [Tachysurus vachellii]
MAHSLDTDSFNVEGGMLNFSFGRGRFSGDCVSTPGVGKGSGERTPGFCSTQIIGQTPEQLRSNPLSVNSDLNDVALHDLVTHIAQEVGRTIISAQSERRVGERETSSAQTHSLSAGQSFSEIPSLNLTGVKLVMQSEVKEPPLFRGDGTDKFNVHEWGELMDTFLRKRGIPTPEHHHEILTRLMGKAKDIVRITLRSNTSLRPSENPKVIFDILKQHFSEARFSYMPLADFYSTVPVAGENPVEYWVRLNKAADVAEEALIRLGRQMDNPCQEAAMMFVKYCPDPSLTAIFRLKAPDKWTASEVQEHLDRYQLEQKEQSVVRSKRDITARNATAHTQSLMEGNATTGDFPVVTPDDANATTYLSCNTL